MQTRLKIYKEIYVRSLLYYTTTGMSQDTASRRASINAVKNTDKEYYKQFHKFDTIEMEFI